MADRRRARKRAAEAAGFRLLLALVRPLPEPAAGVLARWLGRLAFDVARVRRRVAVENVLTRLAPAGGRAEAERIARRSYVVMARTFLDLLRADRLSETALWRRVSREEFDWFRTLRESGQGGLLVSGHFGNWELLVLGIRRMGIPVSAMAADQANPLVDRTVKEMRARAGIPTLSARREVRAALEAVERGDYVATLLDQDARRKGVFVDFLGAPASCHTGIVTMAVRTGKPLLPGALVDEGGRYRLVRGEPWRPESGRTEEENVRAGVTHFHRFLEEQVRAHPGNYFWAHRRWKSRPPEETR